MSERAQFDNSAIAVAAFAGLVLIGATVFFLPKLYCDSPSATCPKGLYDVTWASSEAAATTFHLGDDSTPVDATTQVNNVLLESVMLSVPAGSCTDTRPAPQFGQQPAKITWRDEHLDVASTHADDAPKALHAVWAGNLRNETSTYKLHLEPSRAASQAPSLPIGSPLDESLTVAGSLMVHRWNASVTKHDTEAGK